MLWFQLGTDRCPSWCSSWWFMVSSIYPKAQANGWHSLGRWYFLFHMEWVKKAIKQNQSKRHLPFDIRIWLGGEPWRKSHFNILTCSRIHPPNFPTWLVPCCNFLGEEVPWATQIGAKDLVGTWATQIGAKDLVGTRMWAMREIAGPGDSGNYVGYNSSCLEEVQGQVWRQVDWKWRMWKCRQPI